jgi:hypothetical protein
VKGWGQGWATAHAPWNSWPHGSWESFSPTARSPRQMLHSSGSAAASATSLRATVRVGSASMAAARARSNESSSCTSGEVNIGLPSLPVVLSRNEAS